LLGFSIRRWFVLRPSSLPNSHLLVVFLWCLGYQHPWCYVGWYWTNHGL
jgi:hypothetical protein